MQNAWSESEVETIVEDYFAMLRLELEGMKYNKKQHNEALQIRLQNRNRSAIEFKHQNISAVLIEMGMRPIDGYKPLPNYQRTLLPEAIDAYLLKHPEVLHLFQRDVEFVPQEPTVADILSALEKPPESAHATKSVIAEPPIAHQANRINYLEQEAHNQALGNAGERFVINYERARLIQAGKELLAERVEHVAVTVGPRAGFDIRSFEVNGTDRLIEAKTTKYGKSTPFFVSPHELETSKKHAQNYLLFWVFFFREAPRFFTLNGCLSDHCVLRPTEYMASVL